MPEAMQQLQQQKITSPATEDLRRARELLKEWNLARYLDRVKREPIITLKNDSLLGVLFVHLF